MQPERSAIEHQLILASDLVGIDERQIAFGDARDRDVEPNLLLVVRVRRAVGHDKQLCTGLGETLDHVLVVAPLGPDVLADRHADAHAAEVDGTRGRARRKQAALVEHAIVGQVHLHAHRRDGAAVEQAAGVVELAVVRPRRADQQRRPAIGGLARKLLDLGAARRLQGRLEHEVLGRIAAQKEFRQHHQIGAVGGSLRARAASLVGIAGDVADGRIELRNRDREAVSRTCVHGSRSSASARRTAIAPAVAVKSGPSARPARAAT